MSKVRILGARLSSNPETAVVEHEQGINGVVNSTVNGKLFYVVDIMVLQGAVPIVKSQNVWANDNGKFPISVDDYNKYNKGAELNGKLVRFDDVPAYEVEGKTFTHVNLLVMEGQEEATIVGSFIKRQGQIPVDNGMKKPILNMSTGTSNLPDGETPPAEKATKPETKAEKIARLLAEAEAKD